MGTAVKQFWTLASAMFAVIVMAACAFAADSDTAYVPFVVNVDATVTAAQDGRPSVTLNVTKGVEGILKLPLDAQASVWNTGGAQGQLNAPMITGSRGNITLRLPAQPYQNAEIALYSVNGKRIMRSKVSAPEAASGISRKNVAPGVYLLSVIGVDGNAFTSRLTHSGGNMNISVAFGNVLSGRQLAKAAAAANWDITVSAEGYTDFSYTISADAGTTYSTQNITLQAIRYTITYSLDGGTVSASNPNPASYTVDTAAFTLRNPTKTGYAFVGWTGTNGETPQTSVAIPQGSTGDRTYTANWALGKYRVTFNANGGTVSPTFDSTGSDYKLADLPTPTRDGYAFKGWYTTSTGSTTVTTSRVYTANTTIYAQWTVIQYAITYALDGGTVSSANPASYTVETAAFTLRNPTKTGYTFTGWTGTNGTTPQTTVTIPPGSTGDRSYTANWTLNRYRVTFDANGGTVSPTFDSTGSDWKLAELPTPTRDGYVFIGWYTTSTGSTTVTTSRVYTANTTIYARWAIGTLFVDDRDGKSYRKVTIGEQTWMAENLNYRNSTGSNDTVGVCYNNSADSCAKYGRLYNWSTAMNGASSSSLSPSGVRGVCPAGWHLPSDAEWTALTNFVGSPAGTKLKSTSGWVSNGNGTDDFGFAALPGGDGNSGGGFDGAGNYGDWWSATENGASLAWYRFMYYSNENVVRNNYGVKSGLFSVRCVED